MIKERLISDHSDKQSDLRLELAKKENVIEEQKKEIIVYKCIYSSMQLII